MSLYLIQLFFLITLRIDFIFSDVKVNMKGIGYLNGRSTPLRCLVNL